MAFLSKTRADAMQMNSKPTRTRYIGQLYPEIFNCDGGIRFKKNMPLDIIIAWRGKYTLNSNALPRETCPVCGTKSLIPYSLRASMLSGCHVIKFYCLKCHDRYASNAMSAYYQQICGRVAKMKASH